VPKYYFHIHGDRASLDDVGEECRDKEAAWREATKVTGEMFKDIDGKFRPGQEWCLEVLDENRKRLWTIHIDAKEYA
jgi:hypothetical protein